MTAGMLEESTIELEGEHIVDHLTSRLRGFGKLTADEKKTIERSLVRFLQLRFDLIGATPGRVKSIEQEMAMLDATVATIFQRLKARTWQETKELAIALLIEGLKVAL